MVYEWLLWRTDLKLIGKKRYIVDWVDKVVNDSLPFTPSVEYSKYVEHSNIKEYEIDKKM